MKPAVKISIRAFALAACLAGTGAQSLWAGEAIIVGNSKERIEPGKESKAETGLFGKSIGKVDSIDPMQSFTPTLLPSIRPRNMREELRRQNEADERKNWLSRDSGDLGKGNGTFGVDDRRYSLEGLEKQDQSRDQTSRNVNSGSGKPGLKDGKPTPELLHQMQMSRQEEADSDLLKTAKPPGSMHTASELNFKKMFDPVKTGNGLMGLSKSDLSLKDLFGNSQSTMEDKFQENHATKFNDFLNGSSGPSLANGADPFKGPALSFRPEAPIDFTPKAAPASSPLFPGSGAGSAGSGFSTAIADPNYGRANPFSTPAPATREPARSFTPAAPKEFPRRSF